MATAETVAAAVMAATGYARYSDDLKLCPNDLIYPAKYLADKGLPQPPKVLVTEAELVQHITNDAMYKEAYPLLHKFTPLQWLCITLAVIVYGIFRRDLRTPVAFVLTIVCYSLYCFVRLMADSESRSFAVMTAVPDDWYPIYDKRTGQWIKGNATTVYERALDSLRDKINKK